MPNQRVSVIVGLRRLLLVIYLVGAVGISLELLLMGHVEGIWQRLPILLIGTSFVALVAQAIWRHRRILRVFQFNMILIICSAIVGVWLHFDGKSEFKLEIDPSLSGWDLVWECIRGHSLPPVLAPGTMLLLGLIGVACFYRHPILIGEETSKSKRNEE